MVEIISPGWITADGHAIFHALSPEEQIDGGRGGGDLRVGRVARLISCLSVRPSVARGLQTLLAGKKRSRKGGRKSLQIQQLVALSAGRACWTIYVNRDYELFLENYFCLPDNRDCEALCQDRLLLLQNGQADHPHQEVQGVREQQRLQEQEERHHRRPHRAV